MITKFVWRMYFLKLTGKRSKNQIKSVFLSSWECTYCSKPWSFIMSVNICPSEWLNNEPDLLSRSGQAMSLKLKSPRTCTERCLLQLRLFLIRSSWSRKSWKSSLEPPDWRYQFAVIMESFFGTPLLQQILCTKKHNYRYGYCCNFKLLSFVRYRKANKHGVYEPRQANLCLRAFLHDKF